MNNRLKGKICLITGAAFGIGAATARAFSAEGAQVIVTDINSERGREVAEGLPDAAFIRVDVTSEDEVAAAIDFAVSRFGSLDCIVNNAGLIGAVGPIAETSSEQWRRTFSVLVDGVFLGMKHAARVMRPRGSGCILNTASTAGLIGGLGAHAYTAAKHAIVGLTKSVASELASSGIRVNAVAPGSTVTELAVRYHGSEDSAALSSANDSPMKQPIYADDIARGFLYLASDEGNKISGQVLVIDGGFIGTTSAGYGNKIFHSGTPGFVGASG